MGRRPANQETQKCVPRQMRDLAQNFLCDALAIIRYNYLTVEYARRLSKCQVIWHPVEVTVVFGLLYADCFEQRTFPFMSTTITVISQ